MNSAPVSAELGLSLVVPEHGIVPLVASLYYGTDDRDLSDLVEFIKPDGLIGIVDIAFTRDVRSIEDAPKYRLRPQY